MHRTSVRALRHFLKIIELKIRKHYWNMTMLFSSILNCTRGVIVTKWYTGRCTHFKVVFKALKPRRARAHFVKIKGKAIEPCHKVPNYMHALYKLEPARPPKQATQKEADQLFGNTKIPIVNSSMFSIVWILCMIVRCLGYMLSVMRNVESLWERTM